MIAFRGAEANCFCHRRGVSKQQSASCGTCQPAVVRRWLSFADSRASVDARFRCVTPEPLLILLSDGQANVAAG